MHFHYLFPFRLQTCTVSFSFSIWVSAKGSIYKFHSTNSFLHTHTYIYTSTYYEIARVKYKKVFTEKLRFIFSIYLFFLPSLFLRLFAWRIERVGAHSFAAKRTSSGISGRVALSSMPQSVWFGLLLAKIRLFLCHCAQNTAHMHVCSMQICMFVLNQENLI